jgi:hypothetical protein
MGSRRCAVQGRARAQLTTITKADLILANLPEQKCCRFGGGPAAMVSEHLRYCRRSVTAAEGALAGTKRKRPSSPSLIVLHGTPPRTAHGEGHSQKPAS